MPVIPIPEWLAVIIAGVLAAQLIGAIAWAIRTDRSNAVRDQVVKDLAKKIDEIAEILRTHSLAAFRVEVDTLRREQESHAERLRQLEAAQARARGREQERERVPLRAVEDDPSGPVTG